MNEEMLLLIKNVLSFMLGVFFAIIGLVMCEKALENGYIVLAVICMLLAYMCGNTLNTKLLGVMNRWIEKEEKEEVNQ